jgi:hypothetical protein
LSPSATCFCMNFTIHNPYPISSEHGATVHFLGARGAQLQISHDSTLTNCSNRFQVIQDHFLSVLHR